ncbi:RNaseH domain-containing protein [Okeania sp. SIO2B3]|uniref:RNaseH domain-containing protein n=1 Tax=Okeania sp. SIO2B3 TaxID=2607784 RepID=UPI0013BF4047|nr:RNaseH domain-containing protein [Okeania sp. SIO2B3]NET45170.1 RNAseH domain-containing protein [Okeania sp. SIO2B3]
MEKEQQNLINDFVSKALKDCLYTKIGDNSQPHVLFMLEAQNSRGMLKWLTNPNLPSGTLPQEIKRNLRRQADCQRLSIVRIRTSKNQEVPVWSVEDKPGSRTSGVFRWDNVCDENNQSIYFSLRQLLNTEQGVLKIKESRLEAGKKTAGNPPLLEIAIVYSVLEYDTLTTCLHRLRNRWAYFGGTTALPFPFIFAQKAKEYAVSVKDSIESIES